MLPLSQAGDASSSDGVKLEAPQKRPDLSTQHQTRIPKYDPVKEYDNTKETPTEREYDARRRERLNSLMDKDTAQSDSQSKMKNFTIERRERLNDELNDDSLVDATPPHLSWWERWFKRGNAE